MKITLNTLTSVLAEATADCYVCVSDDAILALRNALVDIAKSHENGCMNIHVDDDTDDGKHYVADLMLTKACNIASEVMQTAKSFSNVTIKESDLNYENIAWKAINWVNEGKEEPTTTPETITITNKDITEEILQLACKRAEKGRCVTMKYAQGAHALHEGKTLIEICHVDFFDDPCMREDMLKHINDSLNYDGSACHDSSVDRVRKYYADDKTYCLDYLLFTYILERASVWTDQYYERTGEFRDHMDMA